MAQKVGGDRLHYTIVLALMISVITTFLLGVLLTEAMFSKGLNYFAEIKGTVAPQATQAAILQKQFAGQFRPPQIPQPSLSLSNTYVGTTGSGSSLQYLFHVNIRNTGNSEFKKIGFIYAYDPRVLKLVAPLSPVMSVSEKKPNLLQRLLQPNVAYAQVSIDFPPFPPSTSKCTHNTLVGKYSCQFGSITDTLAAGDTWGLDLPFKPVARTVSMKPTIFEKFFTWLTSAKQADAQVSIDFPTIPVITKTTATIPNATDVNNWQLTTPIESTASASL